MLNATDERTTSEGMEKIKGCMLLPLTSGVQFKNFQNVMKVEDKPLFDDLLASRNFLLEHSRQEQPLSAVLAQKPVWTTWTGVLQLGGVDCKAPDTKRRSCGWDILFR